MTDNPSKHQDDKHSARRRVLKRLLVGGGVAATAKMMPDEWQKPIVESVILPAHAEMSPNSSAMLTEHDTGIV